MKKLVIMLGLVLVSTVSYSKPTIYLVEFGNFSRKETLLAKQRIESFYRANVIILEPIKAYSEAKVPVEGRYSASKLMDVMKAKYPKADGKLIGLIKSDITNPKIVGKTRFPYWGIFGLGEMNGRSAVISTFRMKSNHDDKFVKTCLHEVGHTFGAPHCNSSTFCMMNDAKGKGSQVDQEKIQFCNQCWGVIKPNLKAYQN